MSAADPLHDLKLRFLDRCREHATVLGAFVERPDRISQAGEMDGVVKIVHSIAGTGGIFGYEALSAMAHELETTLIASEPADPATTLRQFQRLCQELGHACRSNAQERA